MQEGAESKKQRLLNKGASNVLPPGVDGNTYGHLFLEIGNLEWLIYEGVNYLEDDIGGTGKGVFHLYSNIKFWGDHSKGIYLKCANGMKRKENVINKYKYDIKSPEKTFEKYLDDMGVLIIDFYNSEKCLTIGTAKIPLKLYMKREKGPLDDTPLLELRGKFPITMTTNQALKIGEFSISLISSFSDPFNPKGLQSREKINLEDSFIQNEKLATEQARQQERTKNIIKTTFSDERIPSSLVGRSDNRTYKKDDFDMNLDQLPTRERPRRNQSIRNDEKENKRNLINIDEGEDTFHNQQQFEQIFNRVENLKKQMDDALSSENAWSALHGPHILPKKYVPPFLKDEENKIKDSVDSDIDQHLYELEIEGDLQQSNSKHQQQKDMADRQQTGINPSENYNLMDMRFIRLKINTMRIENEELLHSLIDDSFNLIIDLPLPDIYQKKITFQQIKLNNYDIISFNEFAYNNMTLYNFKINEETVNQLVQSQLKLSIDGMQTTGFLNMNRLVLAKGFKLDLQIPLEKKLFIQSQPQSQHQQPSKQKKSVQQQQTIPQKKGQQQQQKQSKEAIEVQAINKVVGYIGIEIQLQRGDNEEEIARNYQIKIKEMMESKKKEEEERRKEGEKRMKFTQNQEPIIAQLYINIDNIRNICVKKDGTINQKIFQDTFNQRQFMQNQEESKVNTQDVQDQQPQNRNIFIQYKSFPSLDKFRTSTIFHSSSPHFSYRSQFPLLMSPDLLLKLENFTFVLEIWDQLSPSKDELLGLVKLPLASFCYSMKTNDDQIFSLNFLADQHCIYPMIISDSYLPIYSPFLGQNIGELKVTLALGTPMQINRQIQKEQESEKQLQNTLFQQQINETLRMQKNQEQESQYKIKEQIEEIKRMREEEERKKREEEEKEIEVTPKKKGLFDRMGEKNGESESVMKNMANFFKQSINQSISRDNDIRKITMLNCVRKMFEEARQNNIQEINGDELFQNINKNFDGSVKKDDFIYALLNRQEFTLTRTEISTICILMLNISRDDNNNIDVDELQFCYKSYLKYYEFIEQRILDLLEKFKLSISKKIEDAESMQEFLNQIEQKSIDSKMQLQDLKEIIENNGIFIRDALYDQLSSYFDLDRTDQIYITSFCEYFRNPSMKNFNFFKINPTILTNNITEFIKNSVETNKDSLEQLEQEFKTELYKISHKIENVIDIEIPLDFLISERINAKFFQFKLKRQGIILSLWEVFTFFEFLNTHYAKMFYEPQKQHFITFPLFYKFITNQDYEQKVKLLQQQQEQLIKASADSVFALAQNLNKKERGNSSEEGIYSSKSEMEEESEQEEVVIKEKKKKKNEGKEEEEGKKKKKNDKKEMTFVKEKSQEEEESIKDDAKKLIFDDRPFNQVKHIFDITVKELREIPILDKLIKDQKLNENALNFQSVRASSNSRSPKKSHYSKNKSDNKYIQNVAVKYSFPLDEDEILESDYIQQDQDSLNEKSHIDYKVSMNTMHTYILDKGQKIQDLLQNQINKHDSSFNLQVVLFQDRNEYVIGNAQLPIDDLIDIVDNYNFYLANSGIPDQQKQDFSQKRLFIYGTNFSERQNAIIGKVIFEIKYSIQPQYLNQDYQQQLLQNNELRSSQRQINQTCFMHRETYVNRKIPLNAILSVQIERIQNIKESIDNIEHFAKIQQSTFKELQEQQIPKNSKHSIITGASGKSNIALQNRDQVDRKRILTQIFKEGLNIAVICSLFEEDSELKKKMQNSQHQTRMLYNTLNPIFNEQFEQNIQMDTNIFEYLKNNKAVFEIRHYIIPNQNFNMFHSKLQGQNDQRVDTQRSQMTDEDQDVVEKNDYIVLGYVKIPLLQLITKNSGIDGSFQILDDFKQSMGQLKLRISLNHHNSQRPLYSGSNKIPTQSAHLSLQNDNANFTQTVIDKTVKISNSLARGQRVDSFETQFILGINFVELVTKNREQLFQQSLISLQYNQQSYLYLKFKLLGQNYQSKFLSNQQKIQTEFMKLIQMRTFDIKKVIFVDIDLANQGEVEDAFAKPLEIQLWFKKENSQKFKQPESEILLGSFLVELNEISKIRNKRIRDSNGQFYSYEGYLSLYDYDKEQITLDRLGIKLYLIKKEYENEMSDLEVLFHNMQGIESQIQNKFDHQGKGYLDLDDLKSLIQKEIQEPYLSLLQKLITNMDYKNSDKIYYSSLFSLPQPYFRYARRFDSFGIIEKFNKEFLALDTHDNGFIPIGLFRSLLEHELKIKEKIVGDFLLNMKDMDNNSVQQFQTLDVNVITHSFKNHIDYITLLRKLILYYEIRQTERSTLSGENPLISAQRDILSDDGEQDINLKIDIESARRLKNPINDLEPPNAFVHLQIPFQGANLKEIETQIVNKSSYPAWHLQNISLKFQLNQNNIKQMMSNCLEFGVYHAQLNPHNDKVKNILIGIAIVDLSKFVFVEGIYQISDYFHVLRKEQFGQLDTINAINPQRLSMESLGQIKICITTNKNLKKITEKLPNSKFLKEKYSPVKSKSQTLLTQDFTQYNPFRQKEQLNTSFQRDSQIEQHQEQLHHLMTQTYQNLESTIKQIGLNLNNQNEKDLKQKHNQNMLDLDELNKKLLNTIKGTDNNNVIYYQNQLQQQHQEEDFKLRNEEIKQMGYVQDFTMTRGYNQSQNLKNQILGIQNETNTNNLQNRYNQLINQIPEVDTNSELDREENVFSQNMSEESNKNRNDDHQQEVINDPNVDEEQRYRINDIQQQESYQSFNNQNQRFASSFNQQSFNQTFNNNTNNRKNPLFINIAQDDEQENIQNQHINNNSQAQIENEENDQIPIREELKLNESNVFEQQNLNRNIQQNKQYQFQQVDDDDEDDDFDQKKMERIERILRQQKK